MLANLAEKQDLSGVALPVKGGFQSFPGGLKTIHFYRGQKRHVLRLAITALCYGSGAIGFYPAQLWYKMPPLVGEGLSCADLCDECVNPL